MAFPTIPTTAANTLLSTTSGASTTHTFPNLTTLAPQAGDLLIAIIVQYQGGTANAEFSSWGAGFTEIADLATATSLDQAAGVAYKIATGSESGTFTVSSAHSFVSVQFLMRIPAGTWHGTTIPAVSSAVRATGAVADPPSLDPTNWDAEDTLWIQVYGHSETSTTGSPPVITASPTNYSGDLIVARGSDAVGQVTAGVAFLQVNASAEDAGVWGVTNATRGNGIALAIAVRPAPITDPTFMGVTSYTESARTSLAMTASGATSGELLLACFEVDPAVTPSASGGWTLVTGPSVTFTSTGNEGWTGQVYYRVADGTASDTLTVTWGGSSVTSAGFIARYANGVDVDNKGDWTLRDATSTPTVTGFTTTTDHQLPITIVLNEHGFVYVAVAGWTEDLDVAAAPHLEHSTNVSPAGAVSDVTYDSGSAAQHLVRMYGISKTALTTQTPKSVSGAISFSGVYIKSISTAKTAVRSFTGAFKKVSYTAKTAALSFSGALASSKVVLKAISGALSFAGAFVRSARKVFTGSRTFAGNLALIKSFKKSVSGAVSFVGGFIKKSNTSKSGAVSYSANLNANKTGSTAQILRPTSTLTVGNWTPTPIEAQINDDSDATVISDTTEAPPTFVKTSGTTLLDPAGNPLILNGINLGAFLFWEGWEWGGSANNPRDGESTMKINITSLVGSTRANQFFDDVRTTYIKQSDIDKIAELGMNCVRLVFNHTLFEDDSNPYVYKQSGWDIFDLILDYCSNAGLYVIPVLHAPPGSQMAVSTFDWQTGETLIWNDSVAQDRYVKLWGAIAQRYSQNTTIAGWDLMGEPYAPTWQEAFNLQKLAGEAIREHDTNHTLIMEGWSNPPFGSGAGHVENFTKWDNNLMFSVHRYEWDAEFTDPEERISAWRTIAQSKNVPFYVGEYGQSDYLTVEKQIERWNRNTDYIAAWTFWQWKKTGHSNIDTQPNVCGIPWTSSAWETTIKWLSDSNNTQPSGATANTALDEFTTNFQFENCTIDYIQARNISQRAKSGTFLNDTFTDTTGTSALNHVRDDGGHWMNRFVGNQGDTYITPSGRLRNLTSTNSGIVAENIPSTTNYSITAGIYCASVVGSVWIIGRDSSGDPFYAAVRDTGAWRLYRFNPWWSGTELTTAWTSTPSVGATETVVFTLNGTSLTVTVNGTQRLSATDSNSAITGMRVGVIMWNNEGNSTGFHLDSISAVTI